ncbi:MAG: hypothetical protein ACI9SP_001760 [Arenicella sp.]|jgi:hypothetical protein
MSNFELTTTVIAFTTAIILVFQVRIALKSIKADHERRKKQATFDYVQKISSNWIDAQYILTKRWSGITGPLGSDQIEELEKDIKLLKTVRVLLGSLEHLSVGVNAGVFDQEIIFRMSGSSIISINKKFTSYFEVIQKQQPTVYIEFQELAKAFEDRKRLRPGSKGNIVES